MTQAQTFARALNALTKQPQFSNARVRAAARKETTIDRAKTQRLNENFNPEVDGCESFVMVDGSVCIWNPGSFQYTAKPAPP